MIISLIQAILLGAIQGITEFLPVSSTAHLIISEHIFGLDQSTYGLSFDMFINIGTLAATIYFFRRELLSLKNQIFDFKSKKIGLAGHMLIVTLLAGLVGLIAEKFIATGLRNLWVVAVGLISLGVVMLFVEKKSNKNKQQTATLPQIYRMGISQIIAFIPGISRSGITLSTGMFSGLTREAAARYSFLLSIPITTAAIAKRILTLQKEIAQTGISPEVALFYVVGMLTAAIVGYYTIRTLLSFVRTSSLAIFSYYRFALAGILIVYILLHR